MNFVVLFVSILFTLFGIFSCTVLPTQPSNLVRLNSSNVDEEPKSSASSLNEKKLNEELSNHADDSVHRIVPRPGVNNTADNDIGKVATEEHPVHKASDRASTTITKDSENKTNGTSKLSAIETNSSKAPTSDKAPSAGTPIETGSSHTSPSNVTKSENASTSLTTNTSTSSVTKPTESVSPKPSSSINKKPLVTYSVEDDPSLLNVPRVPHIIPSQTSLDDKVEAANSAYLPPSSDFVLDRMQSKRELYIFPLVVLIFLVPMVLGIGIIVLRRVRDYWSTRHYRRMDFLVDGMYNT